MEDKHFKENFIRAIRVVYVYLPSSYPPSLSLSTNILQQFVPTEKRGQETERVKRFTKNMQQSFEGKSLWMFI